MSQIQELVWTPFRLRENTSKHFKHPCSSDRMGSSGHLEPPVAERHRAAIVGTCVGTERSHGHWSGTLGHCGHIRGQFFSRVSPYVLRSFPFFGLDVRSYFKRQILQGIFACIDVLNIYVWIHGYVHVYFSPSYDHTMVITTDDTLDMTKTLHSPLLDL